MEEREKKENKGNLVGGKLIPAGECNRIGVSRLRWFRPVFDSDSPTPNRDNNAPRNIMDFIRDDPRRSSICLRLFPGKRQAGEWAVSNFTSLGNSFLFNEVGKFTEESRRSSSITSYLPINLAFRICNIFKIYNYFFLLNNEDKVNIYLRNDAWNYFQPQDLLREKHSTEATIKWILDEQKLLWNELTVFQ